MGSRVWFDPIGLSVEPGTTVRWIVRENVHTTMRAPPPGGPSSPPPGARFVAVFAFMFAVGLGALWENLRLRHGRRVRAQHAEERS